MFKRIVSLLMLFFVIYPAFGQLNIQFRSQLSYGTSNALANIGGYVDSTGKEYALVGCQTGLSIVDISNPAAPFQKILIPGSNSIWREVKVWGKYAYVTTEGGSSGLQIINLGKLPGTITPSDYKYWTGTGAILNQLQRLHSLHIDNGYAYLNGPNGGGLFGGATLIVSLADPWNPVYMGNTQLAFNGTNGYIHDCYVRNDTLWGAHIYGGFFSVINVANKSTPVFLNTQTTSGAFTHNDWLSDAGARTLFTTDEVSNSYLTSYDVTNISNITELDKVQLNPGSGAIVHNTHIRNNYAIVSWYKEGVAIIDVSRPDNLIVTGYYDTYPQGTGSGYNGCWGVYPYLPSGNLVASDIDNGLFVLTPTYIRGCYLEGTVRDSCTGLAVPNPTIVINGTAITKQGKTNGIYKTGTTLNGVYTITISKAGYISKNISGVVLNNGVVTNLNVMLQPANAVSINGAVITNVSCNGGNDGSIDLKAGGGSLPYSWLWNDGSINEDLFGIREDIYTATVTDAAGCKSTGTYVVTQPPLLSISFTAVPPSCAGSNDGIITAYINGGTPPYHYQWSNQAARNISLQGLISQSVILPVTDSSKYFNASAGNYIFTVFDSNNCEVTESYNLVGPNNPCNLNLNLKAYLQGLYQSNGLMTAALNPLTLPNIADSITVKLANGLPPYSILFSDSGLLGTNGWGSFNFQGVIWNRNYYIVVRNRNNLETWSKYPVSFNSTITTFDMTAPSSPVIKNSDITK